jgi:hypothetical protein
MKKSPFILLEVLMALTLVMICAVPLVKQPLQFFQKEILSMEQMEKERLADWTFSEIKEKLLKNEISWDKLPTLNQKTGPFKLEVATIEIPGFKPKKVERSFTFYGQGEKVGKNDELNRLLYIDVFLDKNKYTFRLPVQKIMNVEEKGESGHREDK